MAQPHYNLQATSDMPAVNESMQALCKALEDPTMVDFILFRVPLVEELNTLVMPNDRSAHQTAKDIGADKDGAYTRLMLTIPRPVAMSLARQTVAYDYAKREVGSTRPNPSPTYGGGHKGVYAASIAIRGRDGRFLTHNELEKLVSSMTRYLRAAERFHEQGGSWSFPGGGAEQSFARTVDTAIYATASPDGVPRYAKCMTATNNVEALINMLCKYKSNLSATFPNVPIRQSPVMVGCSSHPVEARCKDLDPATSNLDQATHTWALTLCLIKHMNLNPEVVTIPVVATVEPADLPRAERLVTTIAHSLVCQNGYNIVEGGGQNDPQNPGSASRSDGLRHVYFTNGWAEEQLHAARDELRRRRALEQAAVQVTYSNAEKLSQIAQSIGPLMERVNRVEAIVREIQQIDRDIRLGAEMRRMEPTLRAMEFRRDLRLTLTWIYEKAAAQKAAAQKAAAQKRVGA